MKLKNHISFHKEGKTGHGQARLGTARHGPARQGKELFKKTNGG